jgi:hypothetical protein
LYFIFIYFLRARAIDHAPQIFTGVFGRWRDRARFLTFTA